MELSACRATLGAHPATVGKYLIHDGEADERGGQASSNYRNQGGRRLKPVPGLGGGGGGDGRHE